MSLPAGASAPDGALPSRGRCQGVALNMSPSAPKRDAATTPVEMVALFDFDPSISSGCVRLVAGQIVMRYFSDASGWSDIETHGERGWVPSSFLSEPTTKSKQHSMLDSPASSATDRAPQPGSSTSCFRTSTPLASDSSLVELYIPESPPAMLEPSIHHARELYDALRGSHDPDASLRDFAAAIHALVDDVKGSQRIPNQLATAQCDALVQLLNELGARVLAMQSQASPSGAAAALRLNSVVLAATELVDVAMAPRYRDRDSHLVNSDGTVSHASSLLDELSLHDTCSSIRNSVESSQSSRNLERPEWLDSSERRSLEVLTMSPAQLLAVAHTAYDQTASITAAFYGQLHTFEDFSLLLAFQCLVDAGRELATSVSCLTALVDCAAAHTGEAWVAPPVAQEHIAVQAELSHVFTLFCEMVALRAEVQHTMSQCSGMERRTQVLGVTNPMLSASARAIRSLAALLEHAPPSLMLQITRPSYAMQVLWRTALQRSARGVTPPPRRAGSSSDDKGPLHPELLAVRPPPARVHESPGPIDARSAGGSPGLDAREQVGGAPAPRRAESPAPAPAGGELVRNAHGDVVGGSLPALVRWLCEEDRGAHSTPIRAFFWCFRMYTEAEELVHLLLHVYHGSPSDWCVQLHAVHVLFAWLKHYWLARDDFTVLPTLSAFVDEAHDARVQPSVDGLAALVRWRMRLGSGGQLVQLQIECTEEGPRVQSVLLTQGGERLQLGLCGNDYVPKNAPQTDSNALYAAHAPRVPGMPPPPVPLVSKSLLASLRTAPDIWRVPVLDIDAMELARQITIAEARLFASVLPNELLFRTVPYNQPGNRTIKSSAMHTREMATFTTQLTNWMGECILRETELKRRTVLLKYFVRLGSASLELHNYNLLMAVQGALNSSTILRLKRTWAGLSPKTIALFEEQRAVMEHTRNFHEYRARLRREPGAVLPFLGLVSTDLTFCMSGNPKMRAGPHGEVINFTRCTKLAHILAEVQRFQARPYALTEVPEIQAFLTNLRQEVSLANCVETYAAAAEQLYQRSLQLEPREEHASLSRSRKANLVALPWGSGARRNSNERNSSSDEASIDSKLSRLERVMKLW